VADDRDVAAFGRRAQSYDSGWLGRLHSEVAQRTASVALSVTPQPRRILDIGCGTGYLLRYLAAHIANAEAIIGVDAAAAMIHVARARATDERVDVLNSSAEHLPFHDGAFDLVLSTTSFDHWHDQEAGLRECARVLDPNGVLVVTDLFSTLLLPTLVGKRRRKARTRSRAERLAFDAGLSVVGWHPVQPFIRAFVAAHR
jgi:ubiquinone/menaquinone biosynthesis C-methylase UbiE